MSDQWTAPGSGPTQPPVGGSAYPPANAPAYPSGGPTQLPSGAPMGPPPGYGYPPGYPPAGAAASPSGAAPPAQGPGPQPGWRPALDFRPGIIPLRPLQLGDLYGGTMKAIRGNLGATVGLAALTSVAFLVPATALGALLASSDSSWIRPSDLGPDAVGVPVVGPGMLGQYIPSLASSWAAILLAGFLAYVIGQAVLGRKIDMRETWEGTKGRLLPLIGATLLIGFVMMLVVGVGIGIPILVAVGLANGGADLSGGAIGALISLGFFWVLGVILLAVYFSNRLSFVTPTIVLEKASVGAALTRSWRLVGGIRTGSFWRIFGIKLLTSLLVGMAASVITVPLTFVLMAIMLAVLSDGSGGGTTINLLQTVFTGVVGILAGALTTPFTASVDSLLYVDSRIRTEGLDVALMRASDGTAPAPWTAATNR